MMTTTVCLSRTPSEQGQKPITLVDKQGRECRLNSYMEAERWLGRARGYLTRVTQLNRKAISVDGTVYAIKREESPVHYTPDGSPMQDFERMLMSCPKYKGSMSAEEFVEILISGIAINSRIELMRQEMDSREIPMGNEKTCSTCGVVRDKEIDFREQRSECRLCEEKRRRMDNRIHRRLVDKARRAAGD